MLSLVELVIIGAILLAQVVVLVGVIALAVAVYRGTVRVPRFGSARRTSEAVDPDLTERVAIYRALDLALDRWPEVSAAAFEAPDREALRTRLQVLLDVGEIPAQAVMDLQVLRVTRQDRTRVHEERLELEERLEKADGPPALSE